MVRIFILVFSSKYVALSDGIYGMFAGSSKYKNIPTLKSPTFVEYLSKHMIFQRNVTINKTRFCALS